MIIRHTIQDHHLDNTTSRTEVVASNKKIGNLKTNPLKDGKKFVEWQADGKTFDFSQMPTKNVTVKAIYEDLTDEDKQYYCEDSNYVLDPSKRLCYKVMVPDNKKTFNYTTYTYAENSRFCYAYHSDTGTPGGVYYKTGQNVPDEEKGKQGEEYEGYNKQEAWISKDTCQIASECKKSSSESYSACEIRWDAIIYTTTNALVKEEEDKFVEVPDDEPADDDENKEDNDSSNKENNNKTDKDLTSSPKTGSFLIIFAWVVGIGALIAAVYILKKNSNKVEKDN